MKRLFLLFLLIQSSVQSQTEFSQENAINLLKVLSEQIGPRPMGSPAEHRALKFAVMKFEEYGCDSTYLMPFDRSSRTNTSSGIAVGVKRGATKRIIIIGGHIDSAGPEIPGADDDGSGSAVVMELARVFGKRTMQSTLVFTCFGGEEQGLEGSRYFANHFENIDSAALMLQIDMANGLGIIDVDGDTHGRSAPPWLIRAAFEEYYKLGYSNLRYPTHAFTLNYAFRGGAGSDHESFLDKGIPAIDLTTDVSKPIHTPQDNFENFDPRGLKRSGDVVLKLVERFDTGVPDKKLTNYWLYVIGKTPIFVPYWVIHTFFGLSVVCAFLTFVITRRRRLNPRDIRWPGIKMLLFTLIIVMAAWVSSDLVGFIKGFRYPWMSEIPPYYVLAFLFALLGIWLVLRIAQKLPLSRCSYVFYKRASIIFVMYAILFALTNIELALYPAMALLLLSLAMLVRKTPIKFGLFILSTIWMLRLVFNEWDEFIFRNFAGGGLTVWLVLALFFTLYLYPFALGLAAVYRSSNSPRIVFSLFRSRWGGIAVTALVIGMVGYLYPREVYSNLWYRNVHAEESLEFRSQQDSTKLPKRYITLNSPEYLSDILISRPTGDTTLGGRITNARILLTGKDSVASETLLSSLLHIDRAEIKTKTGDTTSYNITLTLLSKVRPYTVSINYSSGGKEPDAFSAERNFSTTGHMKTLRWYSFPDSVLTVPVQFQTVGGDSVRESIEVVFDTLMHPMHFAREKTNFFQRTRFYESKVYKP